MASSSIFAGAKAEMSVISAVSNIYLQKINRDIQKRALNRQLQKAQEVSLRTTEASADQLADLRSVRMQAVLGIAKQKATARGAAVVQAAQIGGSAAPALASIERAAGEAGIELEIKAGQAIADVLTQARSSVQSIKDQLYSMDMSITPYDILTPLMQIGSAATEFGGKIYQTKGSS